MESVGGAETNFHGSIGGRKGPRSRSPQTSAVAVAPSIGSTKNITTTGNDNCDSLESDRNASTDRERGPRHCLTTTSITFLKAVQRGSGLEAIPAIADSPEI
jgi:hypothetical protein